LSNRCAKLLPVYHFFEDESMGKLLRGLLAAASLAALLPVAANAATTVLGFDDIAADGAVPSAYGGLDWSGLGWTVFTTPAAPYTAHSGAGRITTGFLADSSTSLIRFVTPTVFEGAWFAGLGGAELGFDLYLGGQRVHSTASLDPSATPSFLASGYAGVIDAVVVRSANHGEFVMDDFSFVAAPVPEPETYALMLAGLAAVACAVRRHRSSQPSQIS